MKIALLLVLAILGSALSATLQSPEIPPFRHPTIEPIGVPEDLRQQPVLRIINGREVTPHSIPYQVYLVARAGAQGWSCGGALITSNTVLTAAHCLDGAQSVQVTLGAHDLRSTSPGQITVNAASWKIHERYNSRTVDNDIGVIILRTAIPASRTISYSRLPSEKDVGVNLVGLNGRVSGWGLTTGEGSGSSVLREVNNTVISNRDCNVVFGIVKDEELCLAGTGGRSACQGDSGGPMIIGNVQRGIVSYGTRGCLAEYPSAYVRISKFLGWIAANSDWRAV